MAEQWKKEMREGETDNELLRHVVVLAFGLATRILLNWASTVFKNKKKDSEIAAEDKTPKV